MRERQSCLQAMAASVPTASLEVDFLYEPCLQAYSTADRAAAEPSAAGFLLADKSQQRSFGHSRRSSKAKTGLLLAAVMPSPEMSAHCTAAPGRHCGAQTACLDTLQILQTFTAAPAAASFAACAASQDAALCAMLPSTGKQVADVHGTVLAAVARVAAVEFPSIRWSCCSGTSTRQQAAIGRQV